MEKYVDLTFKTFISEDEMRELLNKPGFYRIPVRNYNIFTDEQVVKDVEVVYVTAGDVVSDVLGDIDVEADIQEVTRAIISTKYPTINNGEILAVDYTNNTFNF